MDIRIFSYLPNPRIWKSTITARLCGVDIDVRGAAATELPDWLWDFDAHPLTESERENSEGYAREARTGFGGKLYKTDAFLSAIPFGTVPAAFSPDGTVGIFESNSIMRTVARLGSDTFPLYGHDAYSASRIDSFLDASLVFARDSQIYLLALNNDKATREIHARANDALHTYLGGLNRALAPDREYLVDDMLSIADICVVAELALFSRERNFATALQAIDCACITGAATDERYPLVTKHFQTLCSHEAFAPDVQPYLAKIAANN
jgi:glutathione S-transferase